MTSNLPIPVRKVLRDQSDDLAVERVLKRWNATHRSANKRTRANVTVGIFAAAIAIALVITLRKPAVQTSSGSLLREDGSAIVQLNSPSENAVQVTLQDRSQVRVYHGRLLVTTNSSSVFATKLEQGRAYFHVIPGGLRRWSVLCEGVLVEVTGTIFEVEREAHSVRVSVERGSVRVSGARVPHSFQMLHSGQTLRVALEDTSNSINPVVSVPSPTLTPVVSTTNNTSVTHSTRLRTSPSIPSRVNSQQSVPVVSWHELARRGEFTQAYAQVESLGISRTESTLSAEELLVFADVARSSGHPNEAVHSLERVLREHRNDPVAPLAAFALGRLQLETLGNPTRAVSALSLALSMGVASSLEQDVRARLVEAYARSGDSAHATEAAQEYLRRFPNGRRAATVRRFGNIP